MKSLVAGLLFFLLLATSASAFVIGVTPAGQTICVASGQTQSAVYRIASTSNLTEELNVTIMNLTWVAAARTVYVPPDTQLPFIVAASPPHDLAEGMYETEIALCTPGGTMGNITVQSCLGPKLAVNVSAECFRITGEVVKRWFIWTALALIIFLLAVLGIRRVSKIKRPPIVWHGEHKD
jgi:hypothetical protein